MQIYWCQISTITFMYNSKLLGCVHRVVTVSVWSRSQTVFWAGLHCFCVRVEHSCTVVKVVISRGTCAHSSRGTSLHTWRGTWGKKEKNKIFSTIKINKNKYKNRSDEEKFKINISSNKLTF